MKKFFLFFCCYPLVSLSQEAISVSDFSFYKKISGSIETSIESNFYSPSSNEHALSSSLDMILAYTNSDKMTTNLVGGASKDLTDERTQAFNDTTIYLNRTLGSWKEHASFFGLLGTIIPTSETSRETNTLQGSFFISPRVILDLKAIGLKYMTFRYYLGATLNFHEYKYNIENKANNQVSSSHTFTLTYNPLEKIGLSYILKMVQGWTYAGNLSKPSYASALSLDGNIIKNLDYSVGIATEASMYKATGNDSNIKIYDSVKTTMFVSLTTSF